MEVTPEEKKKRARKEMLLRIGALEGAERAARIAEAEGRHGLAATIRRDAIGMVLGGEFAS